MLMLLQIARAVGGKVSGNKVLAPEPGHSSRDRLLMIKLDPTPLMVSGCIASRTTIQSAARTTSEKSSVLRLGAGERRRRRSLEGSLG